MVHDPDNRLVDALKPGHAQIWVDHPVFGQNKLLSMLLDASDGYRSWTFSVKTREVLMADDQGRPRSQWGVKGCKEDLIQRIKEAGFMNTLPFVEASPKTEYRRVLLWLVSKGVDMLYGHKSCHDELDM